MCNPYNKTYSHSTMVANYSVMISLKCTHVSLMWQLIDFNQREVWCEFRPLGLESEHPTSSMTITFRYYLTWFYNLILIMPINEKIEEMKSKLSVLRVRGLGLGSHPHSLVQSPSLSPILWWTRSQEDCLLAPEHTAHPDQTGVTFSRHIRVALCYFLAPCAVVIDCMSMGVSRASEFTM